VIVEMLGALGQQHGRLRMVDHRNQYRRGTDRLFTREDLQHAIGAVIAARRNRAGIGQPGGNVEPQPRAGAIEKLR